MDAAAPGEAGLEARLVKIVRACPELMAAFRAARALDLPDWWIVSGALYGAVWNHLTGRQPLQGVKDIDLFYFDPDTSWEAEDRVIRRAAPCFAAQPPVEIRNQARVHLWFEDHFGHARAPLTSARDGIDHFASATHCIGMRLRADEGFDIYAPYGLADIFALRVLPNTILPNRATHEGKAARHKAQWPELTVIPWPPEDAPRRLGPVDPALPQALALIHRSFAYMEGRIDPPSSVHRLTLAALREQARDGEVWGIGTPLRACASGTGGRAKQPIARAHLWAVLWADLRADVRAGAPLSECRA